jgi:hypothetical protein
MMVTVGSSVLVFAVQAANTTAKTRNDSRNFPLNLSGLFTEIIFLVQGISRFRDTPSQ